MLRKARMFSYEAKHSIGRRFFDMRYVLQLKAPQKLDRRRFRGEVIHFIAQSREMPNSLQDELKHAFGQQGFENMEAFFAQGGQLCVMTYKDTFASLSWVRAGDLIPRWPIPIDANDRVLSRGFTARKFRGRGMYGRCIAMTYARVASAEGRFLADCHIWNAASLRQFERTGFEIVARGRAR